MTTSEIAGTRIVGTEQHISALGLRNSSAKVFPAGTVLVAMYGQGVTRGKAAILAVEAATNQACAALLPGPELDGEYLFQYIQHSYDDLRALSNSGGQKNLSASLLGNFSVLIAPLAEQRKIAEILRAWDDAIAHASALAKASREELRHLTSFLILRGSPRRIALGDIVRPITRRNDVGETHAITVSAQRGLVSQTDYFAKRIASADLSGYVLLDRDDFAYNRSSSKGSPYGAIRRLTEHERGVVSTLNICFRAIDPRETQPAYLGFLFESGILDEQLVQIAHEGARAHGLLNVSRAEFFELMLPLPDAHRQGLIVRALDAKVRQLQLIDRKIELLREQKRGLMQKLLTGEVRVSPEAPDD